MKSESFSLEKIDPKLILSWIKESIQLGAQKIVVLYFDNHYSSFYLRKNESEKKYLTSNVCSEDVVKGIIKVSEASEYLKSLNK